MNESLENLITQIQVSSDSGIKTLSECFTKHNNSHSLQNKMENKLSIVIALVSILVVVTDYPDLNKVIIERKNGEKYYFGL